jgi:Ni2+-binding GTPase involved in maturation of urease and hydrogenase
MRLHLVGGFLGSGKTTAIAAAARHLISSGQRVGVVTNDQGRHLVDTAFLKALSVPAVEVTGGCFCCNYDDLEAHLNQLQADHQPDVIFAESVGSCADLVATVLKPLLELSHKPASFSVFADSRLLLQRLRGLPMPFSDDIVYIFDQQLEEAELLVLNKADLLAAPDHDELLARVAAAYPGKTALLQETLAAGGVLPWLEQITTKAAPPLRSLAVDYDRYSAGEADLAWLDAQVSLDLTETDGQAVIHDLIMGLAAELRARQNAIGHLKLMVDDFKISLTALDESAAPLALPPLPGPCLNVTLNLRAQAEAAALEALARRALAQAAAAHQATARITAIQVFHPSYPRPTHRYL